MITNGNILEKYKVSGTYDNQLNECRMYISYKVKQQWSYVSDQTPKCLYEIVH